MLAPNVQIHEFTDNEVDYVFDPIRVPVVLNYVATVVIAGGQRVASKEEKVIDVFYRHLGKIIPVDQDGKKILGIKEIYYKNDPLDSTKILANEQVPRIMGYWPRQVTITPADPANDTLVIYDKHKNISKEMAQWNGNIGPRGEYIDNQGRIHNLQKQVIGYIDLKGNAHYGIAHHKEVAVDLLGLTGLKP